MVHTLHIRFSFLAFPKLHSEYVASLREKCNLFLIFDLLPPKLFPIVSDRLVQILAALACEDAGEGLMRKGEVSCCGT